VIERVADVYQALNFEICRVSLRTAEMIKYTCNAFHALKIGFANEIGTLSRSSGVDPADVQQFRVRRTVLKAFLENCLCGFWRCGVVENHIGHPCR